MIILVLGGGGIIGQHMRRQPVPADTSPLFTRYHADAEHCGLDLTDRASTERFLDHFAPDAIVNLAGENRPDVVERNPGAYRGVNVEAPAYLAAWCEAHGAHLVQVSTQAVFGGTPSNLPTVPGIVERFMPPYAHDSPRCPVNQYGAQKLMAECEVAASGSHWTIVRPTFVLGVRTRPKIGRENPVEQMLAPVQAVVEGETVATMRQVCDRWFSVSFAWDVAAKLWEIAMGPPLRKAVHVGIPVRTNRHILASYLRPDINIDPVSHDDFPGLAPRPIDTTYAGEGTFAQVAEGLDRCAWEYADREDVTR